MKRNLALVSLFVAALAASPLFAADKDSLSPYLRVGNVNATAGEAAQKAAEALTAGNFDVIGQYHPENKPNLVVVAFTRKDLREIVAKKAERGLLAGVLKIGIKEENGKATVSMVNPEYLFNAYLMKEYPPNAVALGKISADVKQALKTIGNEFTPFGGTISEADLRHYHYMIGMPYFDDPVVLRKFSSFEEGMQVITKNISAGKGNTMLVYSLIDDVSKCAVFGLALNDESAGEKFFLPVIGEDNLAAMPYEIILSGNNATMLHGRYRIALHWPSLTMGTFTKIISTPGAIETSLKALTN
jgi:hypothetical protein